MTRRLISLLAIAAGLAAFLAGGGNGWGP